MKRIKLAESDLRRLIERVMFEAQVGPKKAGTPQGVTDMGKDVPGGTGQAREGWKCIDHDDCNWGCCHRGHCGGQKPCDDERAPIGGTGPQRPKPQRPKPQRPKPQRPKPVTKKPTDTEAPAGGMLNAKFKNSIEKGAKKFGKKFLANRLKIQQTKLRKLQSKPKGQRNPKWQKGLQQRISFIKSMMNKKGIKESDIRRLINKVRYYN